MATGAKINIKNIDYFKFKKIVIDGNRDDYGGCSREVKSLCDCVQTLSFRDDEFDDVSDRARFDEVISSYRQILASKRIEPTDMRIKNGWWVDANAGNVCSAGKFKPGALKETLVTKTRDWIGRHGPTADLKAENVADKIEGPGLYIFKHKEHQCFQYVGKADKIFNRCAEKMKAAFDGTLNEPLAALLVISMASDWEFYFIPVQPNDGADILRILENDVILRHDCIWPHGLNFSLHIDSLLEVSEFRKSCLRHHWPPESDVVDEPEVSLDRLRRAEKTSPRGPDEETGSAEGSVNGGGGTVRVDSKPQSEGSPSGKSPTENGHPTGSNGHPLTIVTQPPVQKTSPTTAKQPPSAAAPPRRIARPASAPRPPPVKHSSNPTSRPKSPALSKDTTRRPDAVHRSLDADDPHRGPRAKSSVTGTRRTLERPRSSLDGRQEVRVSPPENQTTRNEEEGKGGMTRSRSVSSTTSIDSKKERTPVRVATMERVKSAKESVGKASGIKAPAVQVTNRRRPPTAKPKATNEAETTQEVNSS